MRYTIILVFLDLILFGSRSLAQPVQTIRGTLTDQASGQPLPFVNITLTGTTLGTITDVSGHFILNKIPVGRYTLQASMIGYETFQVRELQVTSGKEVFLNIELKESVTSILEVEVKPKVNKNVPLNYNAIAGAKMLSVEEAGRYAGGFDDPARLVTAFAGIASNVGNNSIIIRGNNPQALQWKMEGVEIPNPNHFADMAAFGGGGITALSSQLLANSDFLTGAMPAEYNNALSGVFDIFMRSGNNKKTEHTFQIGPIGIDFASEGPFRKEGKSSWLFNYRYSTLGLLEPVMPENAGGTNYQDLSFKLTFPINSSNTLSLFGIWLNDHSGAEGKTNQADWVYYSDMEKSDVKQFMGATGISHKLLLNDKQYLKTTFASTVSGLTLFSDKMDKNRALVPDNQIRNRNYTFVLSSTINTKFNPRHSNKTGFNLTGMIFNMRTDHASGLGIPLTNIVNKTGNSALISAFTNSLFSISSQVSANIGLNGQLFTLNNQFTVEPRVGIKYEIGPKMSLSLAYGLHSRLERLNYYFIKNADGENLNQHLGFSKAHHLIGGYDVGFSEFTHLKIEPYFQFLYDIPVIADSSFSLINQQNNWFFDSKLEGKGNGMNYGLDITLEKFLSSGFYYLITASLFNSSYSGGDGQWRNSRFNRNYILNFLCGKEWTTGKLKQNTFGLNVRMTYMGGERFTPVDNNLSFNRKEVLQDETKAFSGQISPAFLTHITSLFRINRKKTSHEFALKIINLTQYKDFQGFQYNLKTNQVEEQRDLIFIPNLSWKVEF